MSFVTYTAPPRWPVKPPAIRTTIGQWIVDYIGELPTLAQVQAQAAPSPAQIDDGIKNQIKAAIDNPDPTTRLLIAVCKANYANIPALKTAFPTLAQYVAAIKAHLDVG